MYIIKCRIGYLEKKWVLFFFKSKFIIRHNEGISVKGQKFFLHLSLSQPLPQPVLLAVEPQPQYFFPNYQLTKENLSPKTDNIYVLIVFINSTNLWKVLRNVSNWGKMTKIVFFPKQFRKKFLNPYHLGTFSEIFPKL